MLIMKAIVKQAIKAFGSKAKTARALGVTRSAISQWRNIPVNRVIDIEKITGIPRAELRPDIYPPERTS
jgi:DNA-binding transcriptional regulator YdaS (Cro superfamily)